MSTSQSGRKSSPDWESHCKWFMKSTRSGIALRTLLKTTISQLLTIRDFFPITWWVLTSKDCVFSYTLGGLEALVHSLKVTGCWRLNDHLKVLLGASTDLLCHRCTDSMPVHKIPWFAILENELLTPLHHIILYCRLYHQYRGETTVSQHPSLTRSCYHISQ